MTHIKIETDSDVCNAMKEELGGYTTAHGREGSEVADIVQKLRARAIFAREENTGTADADAWCFEKAADEIERLRAPPQSVGNPQRPSDEAIAALDDKANGRLTVDEWMKRPSTSLPAGG